MTIRARGGSSIRSCRRGGSPPWRRRSEPDPIIEGRPATILFANVPLIGGRPLLSKQLVRTLRLGYDGATWAARAALADGPKAFDPAAMSHVLRCFDPNEVNVSILGEPIGAALWAAPTS